MSTHFQGGETYIYQYDGLGRATGAILPSGETLQLNSELAAREGLQISISRPPTRLIVTGKANKKVSIIDGKCFHGNKI